jgi:hypothetical protein
MYVGQTGDTFYQRMLLDFSMLSKRRFLDFFDEMLLFE